MIVGRALGVLFDGMTINVNNSDVTVQNNYGNQDALDKFIAESNKRNARKYPLIFYITAPTQYLNGYSYVNSHLVIMMNTKEEFLYKERTDRTYVNYIDPIYHKVVKTLNHSPYVISLAPSKREKFNYTDFPNWGIHKDRQNPHKINDESIITDYVDARKVTLNIKIDTNCLIT